MTPCLSDHCGCIFSQYDQRASRVCHHIFQPRLKETKLIEAETRFERTQLTCTVKMLGPFMLLEEVQADKLLFGTTVVGYSIIFSHILLSVIIALFLKLINIYSYKRETQCSHSLA